MGTLVSGTTPYCSGSQFLDRFDVRTVAELLPDTNASMDTAQVAASPRLNAMLAGSSGKFEAACIRGGKYTIEDLQILTAAGSNVREFIADIVAELTAPKILGRRFMEFPDYRERLKEVNDIIVAIASGEQIFGLQEVIDAGRLDSQVESAADVIARNMVTMQAHRYFGIRVNQSYPGSPWS